MFKYEHIREQDYWLFPIVFLNVIFMALALYASVITFRGPAIIFAFFGIWFTSNKIHRDYSPTRARIHIALTLLLSCLLAWGAYALTN